MFASLTVAQVLPFLFVGFMFKELIWALICRPVALAIISAVGAGYYFLF